MGQRKSLNMLTYYMNGPLDPELERWRSRTAESRIMTNTEIGPNAIQGWLEIQRVTPFDSGNYTCVPSYAIPAWIQILVLPGLFVCLFRCTVR